MMGCPAVVNLPAQGSISQVTKIGFPPAHIPQLPRLYSPRLPASSSARTVAERVRFRVFLIDGRHVFGPLSLTGTPDRFHRIDWASY